VTTTDAPTPPGPDPQVAWFTERFHAIAANVERVIQGKTDVVQLAVTCMLAEGHLLVEDVPGVGKTSLAKALAGSIEGTWKRVQFTPDLLPSDVTGVSIYNEGSRDFEFHPGPVFANIVLGDEINRASPKTQSALLEVMQEHQVTIDGVARPVPRPFMVMATQNPVEYEGTYQLPEAQRDRFLMRATIGYPDLDAEMAIMANEGAGATVDHLTPVSSVTEVEQMIQVVHGVTLSPEIQRYIAQLCAATRDLPELALGVSPRGSLALSRAARAFAAVRGRSYVVPEDVKALAQPVLAHRMILTPEADIQGRTASELINQLTGRLNVPQGGSNETVQTPVADGALPGVGMRHLAGPSTGKKKRTR
jgi:MoxR-like ATPase